MVRILVAEDNPLALRLMQAELTQAGYAVLPARNGTEALQVLESERADLALVDIMMPGMDGLTLIRELRARGNDLPVIVITAMDKTDATRRGFTAGADDLLTKPVDREELLLRIKALLRRSRVVHDSVLRIGRATLLDRDRLTVKWDGREVSLPRKEFELLFMLLAQPGRIYTRRQLMDEVWGYDSMSDDRTVDVHIGRLREKFRDAPEFSIETVRGLGYKCTEKTENTDK